MNVRCSCCCFSNILFHLFWEQKSHRHHIINHCGRSLHALINPRYWASEATESSEILRKKKRNTGKSEKQNIIIDHRLDMIIHNRICSIYLIYCFIIQRIRKIIKRTNETRSIETSSVHLDHYSIQNLHLFWNELPIKITHFFILFVSTQ